MLSGTQRMSEPVPKVASPQDRMRGICRVICERHGVRVTDLFSASQKRLVAEARHDCIVAVFAAFPSMSSPRLGKFFDRDHTTILSSLNRRGISKSRKKPKPLEPEDF